MHDLTAQVTSSLLPFSEVTVDALGEDEITLDSVLLGKLSAGRSGLTWLACGPHLEVVHAVTGERLSAYCFSGGGEHPPCVLAAKDFSWLKRSGLLVGLEEAEGSVLCLYDLGLSRVVKSVVIPGRITAIEPLVSYGGASASTQHLHQSLRWFFGIAAVVTDLGHVLLVDLCLDDLSCSQTELEASDLQVVTKSPSEIPRLREVSTRQGRHLCLQLNAPNGVGATALQYIPRTNQLAVGFSDGYLQLWNMKTLKKEYHSQLEGGRVPVHAFTFQEPENDPRNCCYLWAVQSSQDHEGDVVSLHLLQLAFSERKCLTSGKILYEGLEYCEERYSQDLSGTAFPLRAQTTNTRLLSCQTIEKFRPHPDRDDSMNEVASPDTSVSIFSWQVKAYGQGTPSTYIGVFDINRWYHAQMPDSLRTGESLQNCPYLAVWSLDPVVQMVSPHFLLDVVVHERSLSRGLPYTCPPPEQYFNPTTYNFDATGLLNTGIVHLTCSGYQKETLSFLKKAAPCSSDVISTSYSHCLMSGLLSSRLADTQASSLSQEEQLDAILSTAVETSSLGLITGCIKQWTAEEQPGSALNLRYILDWAWNKVVQTKEELDGICAPLFDSSSNFTDPQTMLLLQHSQRLLSNLSAIFHCLLSEAQELTQKGLAGLMNKNVVSSLISKYAQVVLWFCRTGLLPEGSDNDALQISRPFYTHSAISNYYTIRREELTRLAKGKWCADCLMIDGLVGQCGERLTKLWKRDDGGTGQYPPPTLHALLDIYLLDNIEEATKQAIVIYLLLDVMYSFTNKDGASVESFPTAFAIPIGLVKLVQGLWLLDHHDHQSSFELLLHPAASQYHFEWQHERVLQALMCHGQQTVALRYFHVTKPPITSTSQAKLCLSVLLHNRCLIEAGCLLQQHSSSLNMGELLVFLYESCQELGLIKELLKLPLGLNEQECLEKFLQGTGGLQNRELLLVHYLQQANYIPALQLNHSIKMNFVNERDPKLKERSNTRNCILDQYGKVLPRVQRKLAMERAKPYQHPYTIHREVSRPQPLSTMTKRSANEKVMSRAGLISNVLTKIKEVWLGREGTPQSSPAKSPVRADVQSPKSSSLSVPEPFLGTPITMTAKRKSRLVDLVVHPSCQTPRPLLSPPRPPSSWVSPKSISKAPELSLLQTPQVVKRARALAAAGPMFSGFTPQSILRSSLRPTPVATPSASPGRSITPPLRSKESRITFIEEEESPETEKAVRWTNGMAADSEISLLTKGSTVSKAARKTWSSQPAEEEDVEEKDVKFLPPEGGISSPQLRCLESESSSVHGVAGETKPSDATPARLGLSFDTSLASVRSTDTTLEYYDAPDQEGEEGYAATEKDEDIVTLNFKSQNEKEEIVEKPPSTTDQTRHQTADDTEKEEEVQEDETFEDVMEFGLEHSVVNEVELQSDKEDDQDIEISGKQEDVLTPDQEEISRHLQVANQVTESSHSSAAVESQHLKAEGLDTKPETNDFTEHPEPCGATETANEPAEDVEQSTDLTEFVQRHLFGGEPSSPLTRSAIHNESQIQISVNSESLGEDEEEEKPAAAASLVLTTQKSTASVTSSEPTGTDSHSVVSVNDSEELSSPASEGDEDEEESEEEDEESDQEEEEEDSGSEVEIIEEVQGNGRLPPLQPSSVFVQQTHTHFLPTLSEQEAAVFSLINPDAEMKMVEEDMEGEVVMVRLGADDGGIDPDEDVDQGSSYMELRPSTTLLVPLELVEGQQSLTDSAQLELVEGQQSLADSVQLELVEGQQSLADSAQLELVEGQQSLADSVQLELVEGQQSLAESVQLELVEGQQSLAESVQLELVEGQQNVADRLGLSEFQQSVVADDPHSETYNSFSLTLDVDGEKEADMLGVGNDLLSSDPCAQSHAVNACGEPEIIVLATEDQGAPPSGEASEEARGKEIESLDINDVDGQREAEPVELQTDLRTEYTEEKQEMDDAKEHQDVEVVMLAKGNESAALSASEPTPVGELPVEDRDSVTKTEAAADEEMREEDTPAPAEENGPVDIDTELAPNTDTEPAVEEQQDHGALTKPENENGEEMKTEKETKRRERGRPKKDKNVEETPEKNILSSISQADEQPVPETPSSQKKKAPSTPTRRMTRRTVKFISPLLEEADNPEEDGIADDAKTSNLVAASPRRTPRKQVKENKVQASTPRRSTRKALPDPPKDEAEEEEAMDNDTSLASTSKASSPARRSSRATATRTSIKSRSGSEELSAAPEDEVADMKAGERTSSKTPTPSKQRTTQANTPRRSSRRTLKSSEVVPTALEMLREEKEQDEVFDSPVKRSTRKVKTESPETLSSTLEEEEDKKRQVSSPGRATRQSSRVSLNVYPQVKLVPVSLPQSVRKVSGETVESEDLLKVRRSASQTSPRRTTRSKLWDHPDEELPLLDSPLEVNSETPVADALIKRLQDEEKREDNVVVTKTVRSSKRSTKSSVEQHHPLPPVQDSQLPEPEEDESSPGEHSFIYSPSRRRTRAHRAESPGPSQESLTLVTRRSRRRVKDADPQEEIVSEEDHVEAEVAASVSKSRKTGKRSAKSKPAVEPLPVAEVDLISPLPSPADPLPRALKRITEGDVPTTSRNLRRKRVMDTVFTKPVTRRKKL